MMTKLNLILRQAIMPLYTNMFSLSPTFELMLSVTIEEGVFPKLKKGLPGIKCAIKKVMDTIKKIVIIIWSAILAALQKKCNNRVLEKYFIIIYSMSAYLSTNAFIGVRYQFETVLCINV